MDRRRVSVCVPVYQGERHLRATLDSILTQDGVDFEVVVVDNASTDGTAAILAEYDDPRMRVLRNDRTVGLTDNFRLALAAGTGDHLKLCCADDVLLPGALASQSSILARRPEIALVACRRLLLDDRDEVIGPVGLRGLTGRRSGRAVARRYAHWGINPVGEPACGMFRRSDYEAVGGWTEDLAYPSDLSTWLRLLHRGDLFGQTEAYAAFRIGEGSHSELHEQENFRENHELMRRAAVDPAWGMSRLDRAAGRVVHPLTWAAWRVRRRFMFRRGVRPPARPAPRRY